MIEEDAIRNLYNGKRSEIGDSNYPSPEFGPEDLAGRTVSGVRVVETHGHNPEKLQVFDFKDGSALVVGHESDAMCPTDHFFLISPDGGNRYSTANYMFNPDSFHRDGQG